MHTHLKVTAWLFLAASAGLVGAAIFSALFFQRMASDAAASTADAADVSAAVLGFTGLAFVIVLSLLGSVCGVCAWGLFKRRRWARTIGILMGAVALVRFPIGTGFGVYVLWVLFSSRDAFVQPRAGTPIEPVRRG